ncbi:response regulator [Paraglaciecola aestuariivivens]
MSIYLNILIVDDVEYSRQILRAALLACIHEQDVDIKPTFFNSSNGEGIPDFINSQNINIVYLDIDLPGKSGLETLKEIRQIYGEVMVVMVSGESSADNVTQAIKSGANGFVVKPFNSKRIEETLQNYLKKEKLL